jgi:cyclic lactone autoinducer peptide
MVKYQKIVKGVSHMKNENIKLQSAKALANASLQFGKVSANSTCIYIFHQPKMPDELKKLKKR